MDLPSEDHLIERETRAQLLDRLFTPPATFKRGNPTAYFRPLYSIKLRRRAYLYSHAKYDLWVMLETDREIETYNENPPKVDLPLDSGQIGHFSISAVSRNVGGAISLHVIVSNSADETENVTNADESAPGGSPGLNVLRKWASQSELSLVVWSPESLRANPIRLENLKRLLRYYSVRERRFPSGLDVTVVEVLKQHRTLSLLTLLESLDGADQDAVLAVVATEILEGRCFSDIDKYDLHYATRLSIYSELGL